MSEKCQEHRLEKDGWHLGFYTVTPFFIWNSNGTDHKNNRLNYSVRLQVSNWLRERIYSSFDYVWWGIFHLQDITELFFFNGNNDPLDTATATGHRYRKKCVCSTIILFLPSVKNVTLSRMMLNTTFWLLISLPEHEVFVGDKTVLYSLRTFEVCGRFLRERQPKCPSK